MTDDLRTRIANAAGDFLSDNFHAYLEQDVALKLADAVIREVAELRRIGQVREVCVAMLNADRVPGEPLSDRAWLADTVLNVLNGAADA